MSFSMAIFTFINVWCVTLFATLPMSIVRGDHQTAMEYQAAPKKIIWRRIAIINTIVALIVTAAIALVIKTGIVPVK
jgi:predicted secreted protein